MSGGPLGLNRERAQSQTAPGHPGPDTTSLQGKGAFLSFVSCRLDKGRLRLFLLPGEACACVGARTPRHLQAGSRGWDASRITRSL